MTLQGSVPTPHTTHWNTLCPFTTHAPPPSAVPPLPTPAADNDFGRATTQVDVAVKLYCNSQARFFKLRAGQNVLITHTRVRAAEPPAEPAEVPAGVADHTMATWPAPGDAAEEARQAAEVRAFALVQSNNSAKTTRPLFVVSTNKTLLLSDTQLAGVAARKADFRPAVAIA